VDRLFDEVKNLEKKFRAVDEKLCGTVDDRLSRISVDEANRSQLFKKISICFSFLLLIILDTPQVH